MPSQTEDRSRTEHRLPASRNLDRMAALAIVRLMNREDRKVAATVGRELPAIARAVEAIASAIRRGGRLIYVGAGTSGRLAVLDAAECPPTFGVPRGMVQAFIAGGRRALTQSVEDEEDSAANGARDLRRAKLTRNDVVVGIAASGITPYVLGALKYAKRKGAVTVGVTPDRKSPIARIARILIAADTGAEVVTGSTRLKAGTAQKMVLNMLSTTAMVRLGHIYQNWMIDLTPTNQKLRERARRILMEASGLDASAARHALRQSAHNLRVALVMLKRKHSAKQARNVLKHAGGNLRKALGE